MAKYDELAEFSGAGMVELLEQLLVLGRWKSYRSSDNNTGFIGCYLTVNVVINQHWGESSSTCPDVAWHRNGLKRDADSISWVRRTMRVMEVELT